MKIFTRKIHERSGSLQLSINAIVVLVMAMVVLGLGLGFVRGLFGKGTESLEKAIDLNELEKKPTYNDPFVLTPTIKVKEGRSSPVYLGVFNKESASLEYYVDVYPCEGRSGPVATGDGAEVELLFPDKMSIPPGEASAVRGIVYAADNQDPGSYFCQVNILDGSGSGANVYFSSSVIVEITG